MRCVRFRTSNTNIGRRGYKSLGRGRLRQRSPPTIYRNHTTSHVEYTTETRYQYSKTNWNLYKKTLNQNLNTICWPDIIENELDVELISDSIITALTNAREKSTPIASPFKKKEYWKITPKIQGLIKDRHKL